MPLTLTLRSASLELNYAPYLVTDASGFYVFRSLTASQLTATNYQVLEFNPPGTVQTTAPLNFTGLSEQSTFDIADPNLNPEARKFESLEYIDVLKLGLTVMDATAISLCMENGLPILVFDFRKEDNVKRALLGEPIGTLVHAAG